MSWLERSIASLRLRRARIGPGSDPVLLPDEAGGVVR